MSITTDLAIAYEDHIKKVSGKYQEIIKEHRDYIMGMRDDFVKVWSLASRKVDHEEIKQFVQNIIQQRFGFSPKEPHGSQT